MVWKTFPCLLHANSWLVDNTAIWWRTTLIEIPHVRLFLALNSVPPVTYLRLALAKFYSKRQRSRTRVWFVYPKQSRRVFKYFSSILDVYCKHFHWKALFFPYECQTALLFLYVQTVPLHTGTERLLLYSVWASASRAVFHPKVPTVNSLLPLHLPKISITDVLFLKPNGMVFPPDWRLPFVHTSCDMPSSRTMTWWSWSKMPL